MCVHVCMCVCVCVCVCVRVYSPTKTEYTNTMYHTHRVLIRRRRGQLDAVLQMPFHQLFIPGTRRGGAGALHEGDRYNE